MHFPNAEILPDTLRFEVKLLKTESVSSSCSWYYDIIKYNLQVQHVSTNGQLI